MGMPELGQDFLPQAMAQKARIPFQYRPEEKFETLLLFQFDGG